MKQRFGISYKIWTDNKLKYYKPLVSASGRAVAVGVY